MYGRTSLAQKRRSRYGEPNFVYQLVDADGEVIYVGRTVDLAARITVHRRDREWWDEVADMTVEKFPNRPTAHVAELALIQKLQPRHNFQGTQRAADAARAQHALRRALNGIDQ